jgi:hypothetical protein
VRIGAPALEVWMSDVVRTATEVDRWNCWLVKLATSEAVGKMWTLRELSESSRAAFLNPCETAARYIIFFYKTRARSQQIIGLQAIFMTGHKQRHSLSRMLKDLDV